MTTFTNPNSNDQEFEEAGRFFPSLHACILAAFCDYQPTRASVAQIKAIALLQTSAQPFYEQVCCGFKEQVDAVTHALGITPAKLREYTYHRTASSVIIYPNFRIRHQDVKEALKRASSSGDNASLTKLILACSWGMFLIPGMTLADYFGDNLINKWRLFCQSPIIQTEFFMAHFDHLLDIAGGDFDMAASMFYAGNEQKTKTDFGKRAVQTYKRLVSAGHKPY